MSILTAPFYEVLSGDSTLTAMLAEYEGIPAIFSFDPVPGDAEKPYIVSSGEVSQIPKDSKNCRGRNIIRDIRIYTEASGSSILIESIAERIRELFHRTQLEISGFEWVLSSCSGPIVANELDCYGRIISVNVWVDEVESGS